MNNMTSNNQRIENKLYVSFFYPPEFHLYPGNSVLRARQKDKRPIILNLNETATFILLLCDGSWSVNKIIETFVSKYNSEKCKVEHSVHNVIRLGLDNQFLFCSNNQQRIKLKITGTNDYYLPEKIILELTNKCNQRCIHCYGNYSNGNNDYLAYQTLRSFLVDFMRNGLRMLTITGGEPLLYPNFEKLLTWLLPRIDAAGIISNSLLIGNSLISILKEHREKIIYQTSINGPAVYHDEFVGYTGSFEKVCSAIRSIISNNIKVRLTMNVNETNYQYINYVAALANDLSVHNLSLSISHNLGREVSRRNVSSYYQSRNPDNNLELLSIVLDRVNEVKLIYPNLFTKIDIKKFIKSKQNNPMKEINLLTDEYTCGAGQTSVHLDPKGNVRICAISEWNNFPILGNLLTSSLNEIMSSQTARILGKLKAPTKAFCIPDCQHFPFCGGCIARGYNKSLKLDKDCSWGMHFFPNKILQEQN